MSDLLKSKKFQALLVGLVVTALVTLVPQLEPMEAHLEVLAAMVISYILGTGLEDFGKQKAAIEAEAAGVQAEALSRRYGRKE